LLSIIRDGAVVARGEGRATRTGDSATAGAKVIVVYRCRVRRGGHRDAHVLLESHQFLLKRLIPSQKLLDSLVTALLALEFLQLALQTVNVLLGSRPDSSLSLSVVGSLARKL
jgi:hypothetical protein